MSKIALKGMQFHSFHGYYAEEQSVGNTYEVDVIAELNVESDSLDDDLENTINYETIYQICQSQMATPRRLIESVGDAILANLKRQLRASASYTVIIRKMSPLLGGIVDHASYEVSG